MNPYPNHMPPQYPQPISQQDPIGGGGTPTPPKKGMGRGLKVGLGAAGAVTTLAIVVALLPSDDTTSAEAAATSTSSAAAAPTRTPAVAPYSTQLQNLRDAANNPAAHAGKTFDVEGLVTSELNYATHGELSAYILPADMPNGMKYNRGVEVVLTGPDAALLGRKTTFTGTVRLTSAPAGSGSYKTVFALESAVPYANGDR